MQTLEQHIAMTTKSVMKGRELAKLKALKTAKNFVQSWQFLGIVSITVGLGISAAQMRHKDDLDVSDMLTKPVVVNTATKG